MGNQGSCCNGGSSTTDAAPLHMEETIEEKLAKGETVVPTDASHLQGVWKTTQDLTVVVANGEATFKPRGGTAKVESYGNRVYLRRGNKVSECIVSRMSEDFIEWETKNAGKVNWYKTSNN